MRTTPLLLLLVMVLSPAALFAQDQHDAAKENSHSKKDIPEQIDEMPPAVILNSLDKRIKNVKPSMTEAQVFETLGLIRYQEHLKANSFIRLDGAGGNWRVLLDDHQGYSLAFRDFLGHGKAKCMNRTPKRKVWTEVKTSIPATTNKERQEDLNRQMEKLRKKLAEKQRAEKKETENKETEKKGIEKR